MAKYNTYTLENGLRIIHLPSNSQVVYCGYDCLVRKDWLISANT